MRERRRISVIMSVYRPETLKNLKMAVDSILNQSLTDFEFLIYSDGAAKETVQFLEMLAKEDSRIRLICGKENHGLAYGLNECIRQAKGAYIARMDDDDCSLTDRLSVQAEYLDSHPQCSFVGCSAQLIDECGVWGSRRMPENPCAEDFLSFSPYIHPSVMFRRSVFETCGMYDTSDRMLRCEDYELFMRLYQSGCYGHNLQRELFQYREDFHGYQKRKYRYRIDESRLRNRAFRAMELPVATRFIYTLKPLAAGMLPAGIQLFLRRTLAVRGKGRLWSSLLKPKLG